MFEKRTIYFIICILFAKKSRYSTETSHYSILFVEHSITGTFFIRCFIGHTYLAVWRSSVTDTQDTRKEKKHFKKSCE